MALDACFGCGRMASPDRFDIRATVAYTGGQWDKRFCDSQCLQTVRDNGWSIKDERPQMKAR